MTKKGMSSVPVAGLVLALAVMFLAAPMAANAGVLQSDDFTEATLGETNWSNTWGAPLTLDTGNEELDWNFRDDDGDSDAAWDLSDSTAGTADTKTWTISWDMQFDAIDEETERQWLVLAFLGDDEQALEIQFKDGSINPRNDLLILNEGEVNEVEVGYEVDAVLSDLAVNTWIHVDIVFNRSGSELTYNGGQDLADDGIDLWVDGEIGVYGFIIDWQDWDIPHDADLDVMEFYVKGGDDKVGFGIFDNMVVRDEAYVASAAMVWRTDFTGDWADANWTNDGGSNWIAPIADMEMIVNSGTATVSTDVSATPAGSLSIGGVIPGGTVEIASAGTLAVSGGDPVIADVIVGDGGTLRVNGLLVTGGVNVVNVEAGGTLSLGGGSMVRSTTAESTSNVEVTVSGKLTIEGAGQSYLGDTGDHPVVLGDGDDHSTNLTLGDGAVIDWVFGGTGADNDSYLTIKGLTTLGASLTVNIVDGGGSADSDDVYLIRSLGGVVNPTATILGDKPAGWTGTLEWIQRGASLWDLQLTGLTTGQNPGDTNGDGFVNETDRANFELALGLAGAELIAKGFAFDPDFDNDGDADLDDFVMLRESFGNNYNLTPASPDLSQAPEPCSAVLMLLGLGAVIRRKPKCQG
jgi:hypothetical protein